jgi:asparagine synthase (glutamine-hydrolysing)
MCGIAGYFGDVAVEPKQLDECFRRMRRRGPDSVGHRHFRTPTGKNVHLLHSRLNIIDLSDRANQPFRSGTKWMVYNGELYNYLEVRNELVRRGECFATTSDTEVLVRALAVIGDDALDQCEGMWAFAVYDETDGSLLLSRDRFGEKPLFLYRDDDGLYFASEVKFLAALINRRLEVDLDHIRRYLVNGYKALYKEPHGFFRGVEELPAASTLRLDANGIEKRRTYWQPGYEADESLSYEDAVTGVRERMIRAVEIRLRADVPLAFCMSGGVDSNSLIAIAKKTLGHDVHGFTVVNSDERYEEQEIVDHVVKALDLRHTPISPSTANFLPRLRELVRYHDAPVYTITYYAHWLLMESIAEHGYRISVSGTAADELFTGYYDHHLAYLAEIRGEQELHASALAGWERHIAPLVRNPFLTNPNLFVDDPGFRDHIFLDAASFAAYLTAPWSEPFHEQAFTPNLLRNRMLNEMFHEAVPVILHEDDHNAMYYSIENRSPFLDRSLFEFCYSIPTRHLMRDGFTKVILRDAMRDIVPAPALDSRRKVGFNAPITAFLDSRDPEVRASLLDNSPIFAHIRREKIEKLLDRDFLPNSESKFLFYFLCSKLFLEECLQ